MQGVKRNDKIILLPKGDDKYAIVNSNMDILVDYDEDYTIYMKNVMFRRDGKVQGIYLGELDSNSPLLTVSDRKKVEVVDGKFKTGDEVVKIARMVTISNKNDVFIII